MFFFYINNFKKYLWDNPRWGDHHGTPYLLPKLMIFMFDYIYFLIGRLIVAF